MFGVESTYAKGMELRRIAPDLKSRGKLKFFNVGEFGVFMDDDVKVPFSDAL